MSTSLPLAARLASWLTACLRGQVEPVAYADAVTADDPRHLVLGLSDEPLDLVATLGAVRRRGTTGVHLALPAPGDPVGLAGPASFTAAALEAEGAVILAGAGIGLVPAVDARTVLWDAVPAAVPAPLDPDEAGRTLRVTLTEVTHRLVDLDVASWSPEIPDLLMNLRHRPDAALPPGLGPRRVETIERALLCREIVAIATEDTGGAVSSYEMGARRDALHDLDRAARRALVATCSDSLGGS